jgi:hypothetical protein
MLLDGDNAGVADVVLGLGQAVGSWAAIVVVVSQFKISNGAPAPCRRGRNRQFGRTREALFYGGFFHVSAFKIPSEAPPDLFALWAHFGVQNRVALETFRPLRQVGIRIPH